MVDALADEPGQIDASPYAYTGNNPISRIDPDGNCWTCLLPRHVVQAVGSVESAVTNRVNAVTNTVANTYNATAKAVSNAGAAVQKFTADNKTSLLATAKGLQDNGDKIAATGAVMAVMGAPVAGVGATPGATVAGLGKITSWTGSLIEAGVEAIAGSNKNAAITVGNEAAHEIISNIGQKGFNQLVPGSGSALSGEIKEATRQTMGAIEGAIKKETDKVVEKLKDKEN